MNLLFVLFVIVPILFGGLGCMVALNLYRRGKRWTAGAAVLTVLVITLWWAGLVASGLSEGDDNPSIVWGAITIAILSLIGWLAWNRDSSANFATWDDQLKDSS